MQTMICELLGPQDVTGVMDLERMCFRTHWTKDQFLLGLERHAFRIFGIRERGVLVAYAAFSVIAGEMEILNIATHPFHRRKGMAKRLLAQVLEVCRAEQVELGFLEVRRSNTGAIDLYAKFGFTQVGTRKNYYPDNNEDALLYRLDIASQKNGSTVQHEPGCEPS